MKKFAKDQKGFTLVELIVVLVILAILTAMLVPALLGYIDRAREGKYNEEIHSIYTAAQAVADEQYAKGQNAPKLADDDAIASINKLVEPTKVETFTATFGEATDDAKHGNWTIKSFTAKFRSQDGVEVEATFADNGTITATWDQ